MHETKKTTPDTDKIYDRPFCKLPIIRFSGW